MEKALILCFFVDCEKYDCYNLSNMTEDERYALAKEGVENGTADIYTLDEFCSSINYGEDCLSNYFVFPYYVDEEQYNSWCK